MVIHVNQFEVVMNRFKHLALLASLDLDAPKVVIIPFTFLKRNHT